MLMYARREEKKSGRIYNKQTKGRTYISNISKKNKTIGVRKFKH